MKITVGSADNKTKANISTMEECPAHSLAVQTVSNDVTESMNIPAYVPADQVGISFSMVTLSGVLGRVRILMHILADKVHISIVLKLAKIPVCTSADKLKPSHGSRLEKVSMRLSAGPKVVNIGPQ